MFNIFRILRNESLNRKLGKISFNFSIRIAGNVISKLLAIITIPIIARALGPETYGDYNLVIVILTYTGLLLNFGFHVYGVREIAQSKEASDLVSNIISARISFGLLSMVVSGLIVTIIYSGNLQLLLAIIVGYSLIFAQIFENDFYFFGKGNMLIPTIAQISGRLVFTLGVFLFIKRPHHLVLLVLLYSLYYLIASGIGIFFLLKRISIKISFSLRKAFNLLKKTYRLGISARLEMVLSSFPIIIISALLGSFQLGIFSAAFRFLTIIHLIFQTIMIALAPYLAKIIRLEKKEKYTYINILLFGMLAAGIFSAFLLFIFGDLILKILFGKSFIPSIPIFKLICMILIPITPISMLFGSFLIYMNQDKKYMVSMIVATVVTIISAPIMVVFFSSRGAVFSMSLSAISGIVVSLYYLHRLLPGWLPLRLHKSIT